MNLNRTVYGLHVCIAIIVIGILALFNNQFMGLFFTHASTYALEDQSK